MKKTIIATSVIALLVGCGSDSGDSSSNPLPSGFTVTGFDGYLQNAVIFVDKDNSSSFNEQSEFLGLTDENGQFTFEQAPNERLSLQTLVVGQSAQSLLASIDNKYAAIYTTDSDRPSIPFESEFALHTTLEADVISPLTDLVVLEMKNSGTDKDSAVGVVQGALGLGSDADLYVNFVENGDEKLHKTAQILSDSKADNPIGYEQKPIDFATDTKIAVDQIPEANLSDPNYRLIVDGDLGTNDPIPTGSETYINPTVFNQVQAEFNALDLTWGQSAVSPLTFFEVDIKDLFKDADIASNVQLVNNLAVTNTSVDYVVVDKYGDKTGLVAYVREGKLRIGMNSSDSIAGFGQYVVEVHYSGEDVEANKQTALFTFNIKTTDATPPMIISHKANLAQSKIYDIPMYAGKEIESLEINVADLFNAHSNEIEFKIINVNVNGLNLSLNGNILTIEGTPTAASAKGSLTFDLVGKNGNTQSTHQFILPEVFTSPLSATLMEGKTLYRAVLNINADIRKCEAVKLSAGEIYSILGDNKSDCPTQDPATYGDLIGNYNIQDGSLVPFSGKVPGAQATSRYLLANITANNGDADGDVVRYLVQKGITPTPETYSVEFYDTARIVEKIVKDAKIASAYENKVSGSINVNGEYVTIWMTADSGKRISLQGNNSESIYCQDIAGHYKHYELGIMEEGAYKQLTRKEIYDVCTEYSSSSTSISLGLEDIADLGNLKYVHTLTPYETSNAPLIQREWIETRD